MLASRAITVQIGRPWREVYAFLAVPENFPRWAAGLGALERDGAQWLTRTADGVMAVRFTPENAFGVVDHWVTPPAGDEIYIPLRVIANGEGAEVVFILYRLPAMTDDDHARDAASVARDLAALKALLEG